MTNLFRNVHALIKKRQPFTDFIWMCEPDEIKGVDIGETYRNEKQVVNSAHYITFYLQRRRSLKFEPIRAHYWPWQPY
jgi:hypothetical protein